MINVIYNPAKLVFLFEKIKYFFKNHQKLGGNNMFCNLGAVMGVADVSSI